MDPSLLRLVAHELRTPAASILLQLERLLRRTHGMGADVEDMLRRCRTSTQRLASLIDTLLEYARLQADRSGKAALESVRVTDLVQQALDTVRPQAESKGLHLELVGGFGEPLLETNPRLLGLIMSNLLENAIMVTDRGSVTVSLRWDAHTFRLTVADDGHGLRLYDQEAILRPFHQAVADAATPSAAFGLGLPLAVELVTAIGGRIEVDSTPGSGNELHVIMPRGSGGCAEPSRAARS